MTTLAQGQAASAGIATPSPLCIRPRPRAAGADSGRATARAVLDDALRGIELTAIDRRFVSRLSRWDKRSATTVAALIARARQAGRGEAHAEAQAGEAQTGQAQAGEAQAGQAQTRQAQARGALTPGQLETVLAALTDAFAYRTCGASAAGCWDCASWASGLCAEQSWRPRCPARSRRALRPSRECRPCPECRPCRPCRSPRMRPPSRLVSRQSRQSPRSRRRRFPATAAGPPSPRSRPATRRPPRALARARPEAGGCRSPGARRRTGHGQHRGAGPVRVRAGHLAHPAESRAPPAGGSGRAGRAGQAGGAK